MFPGPVKVSAVSLSLLLAWVIFPESSRAQYDQRAELAVGYSRLQFQPGGAAD